ncbi:uncharacterized protein LOC111057293 [Nilaparvata lugens]|uniref:uncharacterized protein LOC111057293 n=1 Tax=Nilaparvata lugens TaxID=108931 RepID=UPI00193C88D6|nr:uncharacterized protein LOC111057293 [Nilaparvata lugens]
MAETSLTTYHRNEISIRDSNGAENSNSYSDADRLAFLNNVVNLLRTRNASMSAKLRHNLNLSKSIADATAIERDNKFAVMEYIFTFLLRTLHESVFQFSVNSSLMRDIYWQTVQHQQTVQPYQTLDSSIDVKRSESNKKIIEMMYEVENSAAEYNEIEKECDSTLQQLLYVRSMYEEANDRFEAYRERSRLNQLSQPRHQKERDAVRKKKMKMISSINNINRLCSNFLAAAPGFDLEDTKHFEIVLESRNILTERSLRAEAKVTYTNVSQHSRISS